MSIEEAPSTTWTQWTQARPDLDLTTMSVFGGLIHAHTMLELLLEPVFESSAISSSEFDVLFHLRHAPEPTIARRLARTMGRSAAALSKALAKLERRGLVERVANPADKRSALVTITETGAAAVDEVIPRRLALEARAVSALTDRQRGDVARAFRLIARTIQDAATP